MARLDLPIQSVSRAGMDLTFTVISTADDAEFVNNGNIMIAIRNNTGGNVNAIFPYTKKLDGRALEDKVIVIAAATMVFIGPFPPEYYNMQNGKVNVNTNTPGTTTNFSIAAFAM